MRKSKNRSKSPPRTVNSGYSEGGASRSRNTLKTWQPQHFSSKEDIDKNLSTLRDRAHDLAINSPVGAAAINTMVTNVIGVGLKLFPRIKHQTLGLTPEAARDWSRKTKEEFELWAKSALACDFIRRNNFYELQRIAFGSYLTEGDNFCLFRRREPTKFNPYSLRLQLIEAQRVSNPVVNGGMIAAVSNVEMKKIGSQNRIVNGIEVDREGAQVAIWISNRIWNEISTVEPELKWQRVRWYGRDSGERNLLHICADSRPDQFRGVPLLAPVIESLKQISRYGDAELTSAIIKSFFSIFFVQPLSNLEINSVLGADDDGKPIVDVNEYRLGPATMAALPKGVDVKAVDSSNAQSTFDAFTGAYLKQVGSAINIPYEVLLKNFTASYSASRAALLQAADEFRQRKGWFIADFCEPIYQQWLSEAVAIGRIEAPGFFDDPIKKTAWSAADWYNEQSHFLDPVKETQAMILRLQAGLSTYSSEVANATGQDFNEIIETLRQERELVASLPVVVMEPNQAAQQEDNEDDESDDEKRERERLRRAQRRLP